MEILKPQIVQIGNRCYRKNPTLHKDTENEVAPYSEDLPIRCQLEDETCGLDAIAIETVGDGMYRTKVSAPSGLFKFIIGKKGETKNRLETETRTKITIPRQGQTGDIVIQGPDKQGIRSAKTRIDVLLDSGRQKQAFTHFLSIPLTDDILQTSLADFKMDVLRECDGDRGIDGTIFQQPAKLHLTIGCLVLLDDTEVKTALDALSESRDDLIKPILKQQTLRLQLHGLEYMNDDPAEVDVLYAKVVDPSDKLQMLVDRLVDRLTSTGLMQREYDRVKLHATVMNTLFRKDSSGTDERRNFSGKGSKARESFDATNVLKKFGNYRFGEFQVSSIHLSQRHNFGSDGYYKCAGAVPLV